MTKRKNIQKICGPETETNAGSSRLSIYYLSNYINRKE